MIETIMTRAVSFVPGTEDPLVQSVQNLVQSEVQLHKAESFDIPMEKEGAREIDAQIE